MLHLSTTGATTYTKAIIRAFFLHHYNKYTTTLDNSGALAAPSPPNTN